MGLKSRRVVSARTAQRRCCILGWLVLVGLLPGTAPVAGAAESAGLTATVIRLQGKARFSTDGDRWNDLKAGATLQPGMFLQTARQGALVEVVFGPGAARHAASTPEPANLVRLYEDSILEIQTLTATRTAGEPQERIGLNLRSGRVLGVVKHLPAGSEYTLRFPGGLAGLAGSPAGEGGAVYVLEAEGILTVLSGRLVVAMENVRPLRTEVVGANQRLNAATGELTALPPDAPERKLWPSKAGP